VPQPVEFPLEGGGTVFVEVDEVRSSGGAKTSAGAEIVVRRTSKGA
jgi:hypothetical protein